MKQPTTILRITTTEALIERIVRLEDQLAHSPVNSRQRRVTRAAIRIEADAYRKSLDVAQAAATHDPRVPRPRRGTAHLTQAVK